VALEPSVQVIYQMFIIKNFRRWYFSEYFKKFRKFRKIGYPLYSNVQLTNDKNDDKDQYKGVTRYHKGVSG
jgi:hypothetical protein